MSTYVAVQHTISFVQNKK